MAAGKDRYRLCWQKMTGVILLFVASAVFAAPGFITGAEVTRDTATAEIRIQLACIVQYVDHQPANSGLRLRINLQSTSVCSGVSPVIDSSRQRYRPIEADKGNLVEIIYEGDTAAGTSLTLVFNELSRYDVVSQDASSEIIVRVHLDVPVETPPETSSAAIVAVPGDKTWGINLSSSRRPHATTDFPDLVLPPGTAVYETEIDLASMTWYRLRLGPFHSSGEAETELKTLRQRFPTAWMSRDSSAATVVAGRPEGGGAAEVESPYIATNSALASIGLDKIDVLMTDARRAMAAGETSRAVQIYTKVLQAPNHDRHPQALEYLALAREKNGQTAHAKAEYERYLSLYPDHDGAARVSQRLAALVATDRQARQPDDASARPATSRRVQPSDWRMQTFFSQNYRRDANQQNSNQEIISQSALYSDINFNIRRRGERFDFNSRVTAGNRNDLLDEDQGSGDAMRVSYAYADLADAVIGLRGRVGRQSRNTGGVLGRFDGLNLGYEIGERLMLNAVFGKPTYSETNSERSFYGASVNYGPVLEGLEVGLYYISQDIEGIADRQAVGAEFRYFGGNKNVWGLVDFDTLYSEVGSAYLQGNWRFGSRLTLHGSVDLRHSPFLSAGNALIGQPVANFSDLLEIYPVEEIRQLGNDRSPLSTTYAFGLSHSLTPKLQISADLTQTTVDATPDSGGVLATPSTAYSYFSTNLVASSLLKEGDVSIVSLRFSDSGRSNVMSMSLDSRYPIGRNWRINPRLRIDVRQNVSDLADEWIFSPGLRVYYRRSQKFRVELQAGKQFSQRKTVSADVERETTFFSIGYQAFF